MAVGREELRDVRLGDVPRNRIAVRRWTPASATARTGTTHVAMEGVKCTHGPAIVHVDDTHGV